MRWLKMGRDPSVFCIKTACRHRLQAVFMQNTEGSKNPFLNHKGLNKPSILSDTDSIYLKCLYNKSLLVEQLLGLWH
jgi:hypothetical protein